MSDSNDGNFNDSELQDIMAEIESLEKEFGEEEAEAEVEAVEAAAEVEGPTEEEISALEDTETPEATVEEPVAAQEEPVAEESEPSLDDVFGEEAMNLEESSEEVAAEAPVEEEVVAEAPVATVEEVAPEPAPVEEPAAEAEVVEMKPVATHSAPTGEQMTFQGDGVFNFNMAFPVGEQSAQVSVVDGKVKVLVGDIDLVISKEGCFVEMAGGVNFSVPMHAAGNAAKKAS